jgi:mRNA interferase MazF
VNRGEVWWVEHPDAGRRPACVLTRQAAIPVLTCVLVVPATRTVRGILMEVPLRPAHPQFG